ALLRRGVPADEIAVAHRSPGAIAELLEEIFAAHRIPCALERRVRLADTALGAALLAALSLAYEEDAELERLLVWLRFTVDPEQRRRADQLEAQARRTGIAGAAGALALWERAGWPAAALEPLRRLRAAAPARAADGARALVAAAAEELERLAPAAAGRAAVAVLDPLALRARRVRALFLCGLQEGVFPAAPRAEGLLTEEERRRLVETSGLPALAAAGRRPEETVAAERYLFYAAVSRPQELLALSWHTADDDGLARSRSLFVDDVCDLFAGDLHDARSRRALGEVG